MNENEKNSDFDSEVPKNAAKTAKRLFGQLKNQRVRLSIVGICIVFYVVLNIYTPYYSAGVIDRLLMSIRLCLENGTQFTLPWDGLGREMFSLCVMYVLLGIFYFFQGYLMASVAEKLILTLREQIARKLNKLPCFFWYLRW